MKPLAYIELADYRVRTGPLRSDGSYGNNGLFRLRFGKVVLNCVVSDGGGWDHVSVSVDGGHRLPNWSEMCFVKDMFFSNDEWAIQYHPSKDDYVNNHPNVLHIWRPQNAEIPKPPKYMV